MAEGECTICGMKVDTTEVVVLNQRERDDAPVGHKPPKRRGSGIAQHFKDYPSAIYCPWHARRAAIRPEKPFRPFKLTADERAGIFGDENPRLERAKDEIPIPIGTEIRLSPLVSITITKRGVNKRSMVQYRYTVDDQRPDAPRLLRRNPPALRPEQARHDRVHPPTPGEERQAAEESAYTSGGRKDTLVADAGEAPPRSFETELQRRARLRDAQRILADMIEEEAA